ncbi:MAG: hypothetical protein ABIY70_02115 [Capsulimonas sp.]|uniref:hypothetical protein n=1 Tax=Capsulimonas sp. TaxID=2494211 RepID=UPI0032636251
MAVKSTKKRQPLVINPAQTEFLKSAQSVLSARTLPTSLPGYTFATARNEPGFGAHYDAAHHSMDFTDRKHPEQSAPVRNSSSHRVHNPIRPTHMSAVKNSQSMSTTPTAPRGSNQRQGASHTARERRSIPQSAPVSHNPFDPNDTEFGVFFGHDVLQPTANVSAGWGDTLAFGAPKIARKYIGEALGVGDANDAVQYDSLGYHAGEALGTIHSALMGAGGGLKAAGVAISKKEAAKLTASGVKTSTTEFSHWIPNRYLKKTGSKWIMNKFGRSKWNGNYVTPQRHSMHDPFRYLAKAVQPTRFSPTVQQLDRVPRSIYGTGAGAALGQGHRVLGREK